MLVKLLVAVLLYACSGIAVLADHPVGYAASNYGPVSYADAVDKAAPAVVSIQTTKHIPIERHPLLQDPFFRLRFFGDPDFFNEVPQQEQLQRGLGSGVIINSRGYVLTNNHVIKGADSIAVKLSDNRIADAVIIGTDPQTDLAVLQINLGSLPVINLGSSARLRVGDVVLAIGNPFGFEKTVTQGIVSATGSLSSRTNMNTSETIAPSIMLDNLIQTDAAINPGNSGGALIDAYGNLIGINMAIISGSGGSHGIGFAIPIDTAKDVLTQLIHHGHMTRGWLGAYLSELTQELRKAANFSSNGGIYVQGTFNNSPAKKAGILAGDIIVKINNVATTTTRNAIRLVASLQPGKQYQLEIFRAGRLVQLAVVIAARPQEK